MPRLPRLIRRLLAGSLVCVALILVLRLALFAGPLLPVQPLPDEPLVDLHCHVAGLGFGDSGCFVSAALRDNWRFDFYLRSFGVSRREIERQGDALIFERLSALLARSRHVRRAVVLAIDGVVDAAGELDRERTEFYVPNEFVAQGCLRYPNLLFGASVNPYRRDALARLDQAAADGAVLIKWLPPIQHIDPADERIVPFYLRLVELHLPLLTHTGEEHSFTHSADDLSDPERLRLPLSLGVTVIAAHAASPGAHDGEEDIERLARLMPLYPNLYTEISSLTQINKLGLLGRALRRPEFAGRMLYATDFPLIGMALVSPWYFPLNLTISEMRRIDAVENPWDRDVELKRALGVPQGVFASSARLLSRTTGGALPESGPVSSSKGP